MRISETLKILDNLFEVVHCNQETCILSCFMDKYKYLGEKCHFCDRRATVSWSISLHSSVLLLGINCDLFFV